MIEEAKDSVCPGCGYPPFAGHSSTCQFYHKPETEEEVQDFRQRQSTGSRLAEYLTGLRPEDPEILERLAEDHKIIRAKYGLPTRTAIFGSPSEYEHFLRNLALKMGVAIRNKSDCGKFFEENSSAGAFYDEESNIIGADIDKSDLRAYLKSLSSLEHELIHGFQDSRSPQMPIELMEYEAYIAGINPDALRKYPEATATIFDWFMSGSVKYWYENESRERGEEIKPEWDNPEYFLDKDRAEIKKAA